MIKRNDDEIYPEELTRTAKGAGTIFIGILFGRGMNYLYYVYVAKFIGLSQFGVYSFGLAVFNIVMTISLLGLNNGVLRFVALYNGTNDAVRVKGTIFSALKIVLLTGSLVTISLALSSEVISNEVLHNGKATVVLILFAVSIPFFAVSSIVIASIQALQVMKYKVLVESVFKIVLMFILTAFFFLLDLRLSGVLYAYIITGILEVILSLHFLKKLFPLFDRDINSEHETKRLLSFSLPLFFVGFFFIGITRIDTLMLGYFKSVADVGVYNAAFRTAIFLSVFLNSFNAIFAPMISDLYNRKEMKRLETLFKTITKWIFTLSIPVFLLMFSFSKEILGIFGPQFVTGSGCLRILAAGHFINVLTGSVAYMLIMSGRPNITLLNTLTAFIASVLLNYLLIPPYGIFGAAVAYAITFGILNFVGLIEVYCLMKIHPYDLSYYKPFLATLILTLSGYLFKQNIGVNSLWFLILLAVCFVCFYVLILRLFGFEKEDEIVFNKLKEKFVKFLPLYH